MNDQVKDQVERVWDYEKILQAANHKGRIVYKVRYRDEQGKSRTIWQYADDLPEDVRKEYHIKYTLSKRPHVNI